MLITVENIPAVIRTSSRAVVWRRVVRDGKDTKVPYDPKRPTCLAAVDDPSTWGSFQVALDVTRDDRADGVGIVLGDGLTGIDLDGCRDARSGLIEPWAAAIIQQLNSYTEVSPSARGVHVLVRGALPAGRRRQGPIEMYAGGRFFTLTGEHVAGTPQEIVDRTSELACIHARVFGRPVPILPRRVKSSAFLDLDDRALIDRACAASNGHKFQSLWAGDTSAYPSASEADAALCMLLAFWSRCDPARMDSLFRQSALMRPKWDARRGTVTYGELTIRTAIAACRTIYNSSESVLVRSSISHGARA